MQSEEKMRTFTGFLFLHVLETCEFTDKRKALFNLITPNISSITCHPPTTPGHHVLKVKNWGFKGFVIQLLSVYNTVLKNRYKRLKTSKQGQSNLPIIKHKSKWSNKLCRQNPQKRRTAMCKFTNSANPHQNGERRKFKRTHAHLVANVDGSKTCWRLGALPLLSIPSSSSSASEHLLYGVGGSSIFMWP